MIAIIDYGMGNLRSVEKALTYLGQEACITDDPERVKQAERLILPGVGAFHDAMERLRDSGLDRAVLAAADAGKPLLGICLGMQLLFGASEENGRWNGLNLLPGTITRFPEMGLKIPHMGWNTLETRPCALFSGHETPYMYFVHSYCAAEISPEWTAAVTEYGIPFTSAVCRDNVMGTQFHPEKSGEDGLALLARFAAWKGGNPAC